MKPMGAFMKADLKTIERKPHDGTMIKPREFVEVKNHAPLHAVDHKLFNVLLQNAWGKDLADSQKSHTIDLTSVYDTALPSKRPEHLEDAIQRLQATTVQIRRDNGTWLSMPLLSTCTIMQTHKTKTLTYHFPQQADEVFKNSRLFASLDTSLIGNFDSKYALLLYQIIAQRAGLEKKVEVMALKDLRALLGVKSGSYKLYSKLKERVIDPAVKEVNQVAPFNVKIEPIRKKPIRECQVSWWPKNASEAEAALTENLKHSAGRAARREGNVEFMVRASGLREDTIQQAIEIRPNDTPSALEADWQRLLDAEGQTPDDLDAHFLDFCRDKPQ